ncbi:Uncharacterised protein [Yersinia frederiksenii]|nr:Uncharacterised protein [Yersinia frederiksenii]
MACLMVSLFSRGVLSRELMIERPEASGYIMKAAITAHAIPKINCALRVTAKAEQMLGYSARASVDDYSTGVYGNWPNNTVNGQDWVAEEYR